MAIDRRSARGAARVPLVLMVAGAVFLAWTGIRLFPGGGGDGSSAREEAARQQRCAAVDCRAADNQFPARGYEGQSVVADPRDPDHIVVTDANMISASCAWHTTFDRGKSWLDGVFELPTGYTGCRINGPSGGHVPTGNAVMGPSGAVYATFGSAHLDDARRESIIVAASTDGGKTWQARAAARPGPGGGYARPLMTASAGPSGQDAVMVAFWECTNIDARCPISRFVRSDDGGRTFAAPVTVNDSMGGQDPSQPAVAPDGTIYVTYQLRYNDGIVDLVLAKSTDGGKTFVKSLIDTQPALGGTRGYDAAKLVVDPTSGALYTVFTDNRTGRQAVIFRRSTDGGVTWAAPVGISPDQGATATRSPWMSVAPNGRIDVVFYRQPGQLTDKRDDVFWAFSTNTGSTFSIRQVNDKPIDRSRGYGNEIGTWYPPGVSSTDEAAVVAWNDSRNADDITNTVDTYVRRMIPLGAGLALPP